MATVKEIQAEIIATFGSNYINQKQLADFLGFKKDKARKFFAAIPHIITGKEKKFNALDIAKYLHDLQTYAPYG